MELEFSDDWACEFLLFITIIFYLEYLVKEIATFSS